MLLSIDVLFWNKLFGLKWIYNSLIVMPGLDEKLLMKSEER